MSESKKEWTDEKLKHHFDKKQLEWAKEQTLNPSREIKLFEGKTKINPYDIDSISKYLDSSCEKELDDKIEILFIYILNEWNELALERVMDYVTGKFAKKRVTLESMKSRLKKEIKTKSEKVEIQPLNVTNYMLNVLKFHSTQRFFYDKSKLFWFWRKNLNKWEIVDNIDLMISLEKMLSLGGETVSSNTKNNYLEAFKRIGRINIPKDAPKKWIQFKDKALSIESGKIYNVTPDYFFCNPIPYEIGNDDKTPTMDKLFEEWVGKKWIKTLYEIIAYCCYTDYPIHLIFCFIGSGRNGKSSFLRLLTKFIGRDNVSSTELDTLLNSRFESTKLHKKLACTVGETNFGIMNKTSLLKKLVGQDMIGFEYKGKNPFDDINYAKICISSNSLPTSEDTSEGFYRRWLIIDFNNKFPEGKEILNDIPEIEYNNLAKKVTKILPELLKRGEFTNQGTINEREQKYIFSSNPLKSFIETYCYEKNGTFTRYSELYTLYASFLKKIKKRIISKQEFTKTLESEGYEIRRTTKKIGENMVNDRFIENLGVKFLDLRAFMTEMTKCNNFYFDSLYRKQSEKLTIPSLVSFSEKNKNNESEKTQDVVVEKPKTQDIVIEGEKIDLKPIPQETKVVISNNFNEKSEKDYDSFDSLSLIEHIRDEIMLDVKGRIAKGEKVLLNQIIQHYGVKHSSMIEQIFKELEKQTIIYKSASDEYSPLN